MRDGTATRERIERTAMRLFVEKGIAETTIRDIAAGASVAEGTLYRHYPSKEALAWDLFLRNLTELGRMLQETHRPLTHAGDKIAAMIRQFCRNFDQDPVVINYLFLTRHQYYQRLNPRIPNPYLVFRSVIREGMARGEIPRGDADVATSMIMGIVLQVIDSRILGRRIPQGIETLADRLIDATKRVLYI